MRLGILIITVIKKTDISFQNKLHLILPYCCISILSIWQCVCVFCLFVCLFVSLFVLSLFLYSFLLMLLLLYAFFPRTFLFLIYVYIYIYKILIDWLIDWLIGWWWSVSCEINILTFPWGLLGVLAGHGRFMKLCVLLLSNKCKATTLLLQIILARKI